MVHRNGKCIGINDRDGERPVNRRRETAAGNTADRNAVAGHEAMACRGDDAWIASDADTDVGHRPIQEFFNHRPAVGGHLPRDEQCVQLVDECGKVRITRPRLSGQRAGTESEIRCVPHPRAQVQDQSMGARLEAADAIGLAARVKETVVDEVRLPDHGGFGGVLEFRRGEALRCQCSRVFEVRQEEVEDRRGIQRGLINVRIGQAHIIGAREPDDTAARAAARLRLAHQREHPHPIVGVVATSDAGEIGEHGEGIRVRHALDRKFSVRRLRVTHGEVQEDRISRDEMVIGDAAKDCIQGNAPFLGGREARI